MPFFRTFDRRTFTAQRVPVPLASATGPVVNARSPTSRPVFSLALSPEHAKNSTISPYTGYAGNPSTWPARTAGGRDPGVR
ncbi:hypothetical protein [Williamsia soli]|uniref:hypothetical protein n=1 Tax=Williamsia soli TaxID=364929 RepID=UPI001A9D5929|nr:hypothetical protein [Williamsia soli]